jgi:hypothetical protein
LAPGASLELGVFLMREFHALRVSFTPFSKTVLELSLKIATARRVLNIWRP